MDTQIHKYYVHVFSSLDVLYKEILGMTQQKEKEKRTLIEPATLPISPIGTLSQVAHRDPSVLTPSPCLLWVFL